MVLPPMILSLFIKEIHPDQKKMQPSISIDLEVYLTSFPNNMIQASQSLHVAHLNTLLSWLFLSDHMLSIIHLCKSYFLQISFTDKVLLFWHPVTLHCTLLQILLSCTELQSTALSSFLVYCTVPEQTTAITARNELSLQVHQYISSLVVARLRLHSTLVAFFCHFYGPQFIWRHFWGAQSTCHWFSGAHSTCIRFCGVQLHWCSNSVVVTPGHHSSVADTPLHCSSVAVTPLCCKSVAVTPLRCKSVAVTPLRCTLLTSPQSTLHCTLLPSPQSACSFALRFPRRLDPAACATICHLRNLRSKPASRAQTSAVHGTYLRTSSAAIGTKVLYNFCRSFGAPAGKHLRPSAFPSAVPRADSSANGSFAVSCPTASAVSRRSSLFADLHVAARPSSWRSSTSVAFASAVVLSIAPSRLLAISPSLWRSIPSSLVHHTPKICLICDHTFNICVRLDPTTNKTAKTAILLAPTLRNHCNARAASGSLLCTLGCTTAKRTQETRQTQRE